MSADTPELGVIINADCDLVHGKLDGVIAYLPMYHLSAYLARFWAPTFISEQKSSITDRVRTLCSLDEVWTTELLTWLPIEDATDIAERVSTTAGLKPKDAKELRSRLLKLQSCLDESRDPIEIFVEFCRGEPNPSQFARKKITQACSKMGEGHLFISELVGARDIGYVVRMRRIYTIDARFCYPTRAAQLSSSSGEEQTAMRIARFTPDYRFKIAQVFAHQFSRIGLPDDVAALSSLAVDDMVLQLLSEAA